MIAAFQFIAVVLLADFLSGFIHWLEDSYGREDSPVTGRLFIAPNILHHHQPRHFVRYNWFQSSWDLTLFSALVVLVAWHFHLLTWQVWLFALLSANANQFHKLAHRTRKENGRFVSLLHDLWILQTPRHHAYHHTNPKNSHYCVLTNFLNPVLDRIHFWRTLEWLICRVFGVRRRVDTSLPKAPSK